HDDRAGLVQTAAGVGQQTLEVQEVGDVLVEVVVVGHRGGVDQRDAGATALHGVAGDRQGAQGHAVEGVGEVDDRLTAGDLAGQLQGGLDRIVAGRAGEDHAVVDFTNAFHG